MSELILHHYPQSPVAEKVRVVLGIKGLDWRSVIIPRIPPKPLYFPLTGGYRRTPALQVGADIYCDSRCIINEIERRFPNPTITPQGGQGMAWGVAQWTDGPLFDLVLRIVLAVSQEGMPCDFADDRGQLYFGDANALATLQAELPVNVNQLRGHLSWIELRLAGGRPFVLGDQPGLPDTLCYYLIWLMKERWSEFDEFFSEFPNLLVWEQKMRGLGHGQPTDMTAERALTIAREASPTTTEAEDPRDPLGLRPGDKVSVTHRGTGEDPPVVGRMICGQADMIALAVESPDLGELAIHFPKVGYDIERI